MNAMTGKGSSRVGAAALALLILGVGGLACGSSSSPGNSMDLIILNGSFVQNANITITSPGGGVRTRLLPTTMVDPGYGPALRLSYPDDVGETYDFKLKVGTDSVSQSCTTGPGAKAVSGDDQTGFTLVQVFTGGPGVYSLDCSANWQ